MTNSNYTKDDFLGGRIKIKQPKKGYRITSDTVFLAASIKLNKGDYILDVGAGNGGILSCIAARIGNDTKNVKMHGIEVQPDLILLAKDNNKEVTYFQGDLFKDIEGCAPNSYHNVVTNPPYFEKGNPIPDFVHNEVLRLSLTSVLGDNMSDTAALSEYTRSFTVSISSDSNADNLSRVAIVTSSDNSARISQFSHLGEDKNYE